ncbi:MAG: hypothetical protein Q7K39_03930 [Candidatus Magasanikbacteria bacterium]|nr:hypothetical protein [Candidatus Magasanikbacteria bacterium]
MSFTKRLKDQLIKLMLGKSTVPQGLVELFRYSRDFGSINFNFEKSENCIVAVSTNFRYGSIITSGKNNEELDKNIKDAILTSFEIPFSYASEAKITKLGEGRVGEYAAA